MLIGSISGLVAEYIVAIDVTRARFPADAELWWPPGQDWSWARVAVGDAGAMSVPWLDPWHWGFGGPVQRVTNVHPRVVTSSISGLVAEYIVAIDVTRARFPADAWQYL